VQTDKDNGVGNSKGIASFICLLTGHDVCGEGFINLAFGIRDTARQGTACFLQL
jgi:hypothetical protein